MNEVSTYTGPVKTVSATRTVMSEIVLPNDTNGLGNLMGGRLLHWMDVAGAIAAQRHANRVCVTAAVDSVEFNCPIRVGEVVILESRVNRAFNTSMEVQINVWAENPRDQTKRKCNRAFYTFVAIGEDGRPKPVPPIHPETEEERRCYENAAKRREFRLILAGRLRLEEATHIKSDLLAALDAS
ncbi:acyl-CoA thioesterase [Rhodocaloribacter litoris]|uniref:acyl-CoA thioesterase n=1 Tax=Rhodocaloribacter litoris TaxID=2558931 RepID=UPI0014249C3C|nr:acyl-CoA thioesterase [Rhodocaloribacter litoris]QXD16306.1 acyl-CoA thioesterase [Rhodocaloribacter litoris]GIV60872.1 MAG: acyl-CoA thioesterase [Rhodothermaceae bacterium]